MPLWKKVSRDEKPLRGDDEEKRRKSSKTKKNGNNNNNEVDHSYNEGDQKSDSTAIAALPPSPRSATRDSETSRVSQTAQQTSPDNRRSKRRHHSPSTLFCFSSSTSSSEVRKSGSLPEGKFVGSFILISITRLYYWF